MDIEGNEENELRWNNIMTIGLMDNEGTLIRKWITSKSEFDTFSWSPITAQPKIAPCMKNIQK
jgi:hypothetical protein